MTDNIYDIINEFMMNMERVTARTPIEIIVGGDLYRTIYSELIKRHTTVSLTEEDERASIKMIINTTCGSIIIRRITDVSFDTEKVRRKLQSLRDALTEISSINLLNPGQNADRISEVLTKFGERK